MYLKINPFESSQRGIYHISDPRPIDVAWVSSIGLCLEQPNRPFDEKSGSSRIYSHDLLQTCMHLINKNLDYVFPALITSRAEAYEVRVIPTEL